MWKKNPNNEYGSWYLWDEDESKNLRGSIIRNTDYWSLQIHTSDGGLFTIRRISNSMFPPEDIRPSNVMAIVESAINENKPFSWWCENANEWWHKNTVVG